MKYLLTLGIWFHTALVPAAIFSKSRPASASQKGLSFLSTVSTNVVDSFAQEEIQNADLVMEESAITRSAWAAMTSSLASMEADAELGASGLAIERAKFLPGLPEVKLPDVKLPDVKLPDVVDDIAAGVKKGAEKVAAGPSSLKEYCSGGGESMPVGQKVEANWRHMGIMYPGHVEKIHEDGTIEVGYDDGWTEDNIPPGDVKIVGNQQHAEKPKDDPACQLQDFVEDVKESLDSAHQDLARWMASKSGAGKAQAKSKEKVAGEGDAEDAEVAAAEPNKTAKSELQKLKEEIADKDAEIADLEQKVKSNDDYLNGDLNVDDEEEEDKEEDDKSDKDGKTDAVDKLIARFKARLARRNRTLARLNARLAEQNRQLLAARETVPELEDIAAEIAKITKEVEKSRARRDQLEKQGKLDDELRLSLDKIFEQEQQMREQMEQLMKLKKEAEAKQAKAKQAKEAAAANKANADAAKAAGKGAKEQSDEASHADEEAAANADIESDVKAEAEAEVEAETADEDLLKAAKSLQTEMNDVKDSTKTLDTGVHPSGEKWWRYRYEHSYIEGLLMILIVLLVMFWERCFQSIRKFVWEKSHAKPVDTLMDGTMYVFWLEFFAGEMFVCLMAFLTLWVMAQFHLFEVLPIFLREDSSMHFPQTGADYKHMAYDCAVLFFIALVFYFSLAYSVVKITTEKITKWARASGSKQASPINSPAPESSRMLGTLSRAMTLQLGNDDGEFQKIRNFFVEGMENHKEFQAELQQDGKQWNSETFPFWVYLRLNVRGTVDHLFRFDIGGWGLVLATFCLMVFLHRFAHMGYIRIMIFFGVLIMVQFTLMFVWINRASSFIDAEDGEAAAEHQPWYDRLPHEAWIIWTLRYNLFFLCYGVARMIGSSWMWELHFWPVMGCSIFAILCALVFVIFMAPIIPTFAVALALPPYIDSTNIELMKEAMSAESVSAEEFLRKTQSQDDLS